ncbi:ArsR/SmtB family transcription factor [Methylobacillus flagellatus]|uniref:ArsR/SmtB family transcription factor n=1 Tax=Methylobacillus flagellatus TaxID=405 RepID=UPI001E658EAA|nr:metalloregulator ArsR/SmtB family transcription factor [Methylobacillus flagellatus]
MRGEKYNSTTECNIFRDTFAVIRDESQHARQNGLTARIQHSIIPWNVGVIDMVNHINTACHHDDAMSDCKMVESAQLDKAAAICHALSDAGRLRLLLWLAQREMCVSELVALEQDKVSSVSARLQMLHAVNLVTRRREAKHMFYALADVHVHRLLRNILDHAAEAVSGR